MLLVTGKRLLSKICNATDVIFVISNNVLIYI